MLVSSLCLWKTVGALIRPRDDIQWFITRFMQNPAIKTLKAIREIHNEPHCQQVHMGKGVVVEGEWGEGVGVFSWRWHKQHCYMTVWDSVAY